MAGNEPSRIFLWLGAWLLMACGHAPITPEHPQSVLEDQLLHHVRHIDLARRHGKLEAVREEYRARLTQHPTDPLAHFLVGWAEEEPNAAFRRHEQALTLDPQNYWAQLGQGVAYLQMGILIRAEERLTQVVALGPGHAHGHAYLGEVLRRQGKHPEASLAFTRALELDPDCYLAHRGLGELYLAAGNTTAALRELQAAAEQNREEFELQVKLGELLLNAGQLAPAVAAFTRATELNSNQAPAWYGLGRAASGLGQLPLATQALERVLELQSYHHRARRELADLLRQQGLHERAIPLYRDLLAAQPEEVEIRRGLAESLAARGQTYEALVLFRQLGQQPTPDLAARSRIDQLLAEIGARREPVRGKTLQEVFNRILATIQQCQANLVKNGVRPTAIFRTEVNIDGEGRAAEVQLLEAETREPALRECVLWTIHTAEFPRNKPVVVKFPLELQ